MSYKFNACTQPSATRLIDGFDAKTHRKLVDNFLPGLLKIDLPGVFALGVGYSPVMSRPLALAQVAHVQVQNTL